MRPRVFPAEDLVIFGETADQYPQSFNEAAGIPRGRPPRGGGDPGVLVKASMRPRVFPAEDLERDGAGHSEIVQASMRPRVFPAEDAQTDGARGRHGSASMRPRVFPAEDSTTLAAISP